MGESRAYATKVLSLIICARRPLSPKEILHALMTEPGDTHLDEDDALEVDVVISICAGLVTIDTRSNAVRFVHFTAQAYLQRTRAKWLPRADIEVARTCMAYLMMDEFHKPLSKNIPSEHFHCRGSYAFSEYAAEFCCGHLDDVLQTHEVLKEAGIKSEDHLFFQNSTVLKSANTCANYHTLSRQERRSPYEHKNLLRPLRKDGKERRCTYLHWAAAKGLLGVADAYLELEKATDARDEYD